MNKTAFVLFTVILSQPGFAQVPHSSGDSDTANKSGNITIMKSTIYPAISTWEVSGYLYSAFLDGKLGSPWDLLGSSLASGELIRKRNKRNPGYYLINPLDSDQPQELSSEEENHIKDILKSVLTTELPSSVITKFILKHNDVLYDTLRDEYYGRVRIGEDYLAIGGWFDKFMAVGVYKNFDNVDEFLNLTNTYFQLPEIDREKIDISEADGLFYSYIDRENMFMLRGHGTFIVPTDDKLSDREKTVFKMVIELIKYYDEEFMP